MRFYNSARGAPAAPACAPCPPCTSWTSHAALTLTTACGGFIRDGPVPYVTVSPTACGTTGRCSSAHQCWACWAGGGEEAEERPLLRGRWYITLSPSRTSVLFHGLPTCLGLSAERQTVCCLRMRCQTSGLSSMRSIPPSRFRALLTPRGCIRRTSTH